MTKIKTYLFSAMALGTLASGFAATEALADHSQGRGRGYGKQAVDVYIDTGRNSELEAVIGRTLSRTQRGINIVYSPRYADVTVRVNGHLSRPAVYDRSHGRHGGAFAAMNYNYKIRITANGWTLYNDRIRGEVREPLGRNYGYYPGSGDKFEKAGRAIELFGVFLETVIGDGYATAHNSGRRRGGRYDLAAIEHSLRLEVYREVAAYLARIGLPSPRGRRR